MAKKLLAISQVFVYQYIKPFLKTLLHKRYAVQKKIFYL